MSGRIRLLLIHCDPHHSLLIARMLDESPLFDGDVLQASNLEEGLAFSVNAPPDCIILDLSVPFLADVGTLGKLRQLYPASAIIALTRQVSPTFAVEIMKAGAEDNLVYGALTSDLLARAIAGAVARRQLSVQLEHQRQSLEIFTRAMAHDLKEPLRTIKSFADLVHGAADLSDEHRQLTQFIVSAAANMENLIDSISRYTQLETSTVNRETFAGSDLLNRIEINLRDQIDSRQAEIIDDGLNDIAGDRILLTQLLQNLLSNAIRYCERQPVIRLSTEQDDGEYRLIVSDNGPGIAEEHLKTIFNPFTRLASRDTDGAGLGLSICQRIAELHGGSIRCEAGPGGGARFITTIPAMSQVPSGSFGDLGGDRRRATDRP